MDFADEESRLELVIQTDVSGIKTERCQTLARCKNRHQGVRFNAALFKADFFDAQ
jgi:hypothetical protein